MTAETVVFGVAVAAITLAAGLTGVASALLRLAQTLNRLVLSLLVILAVPHLIHQRPTAPGPDQPEARTPL